MLADRPWQGLAVSLVVHTRRFFCEAAGCPRRIFAEPFPGLAAPRSRRTARLTALVQAVGVALGSVASARLIADLGLTTSPETVLRLVRALPLPLTATPRVLGVDDWTRRRGRSYGTILVDLERHQIVELVPDRTAETLAEWLAAHPGVEIVSRDRASAYAEGVRHGAPDAIQVADRWHLLKNVGDALERWLLGERTALRVAASAPLPSAAGAAEAAVAAAVPAAAAPPPPTPGTVRRQARYATVMALDAEGHTIRAIARQSGVSRPTVRTYPRASGCPGPPVRSGMLTARSAPSSRPHRRSPRNSVGSCTNGTGLRAMAGWRGPRHVPWPNCAASRPSGGGTTPPSSRG